MTALPTPSHNLPLQPNEMLDRLMETRAAHQALSESNCRLLTLVGPGGVGKTRLAIAVGELLSRSSSGQIWFVDLTSIVKPESVVSLINATVGISGSYADPLDGLKEYLNNNPDTVFILDNFEHVMDASLTVSKIVEGCGSVRVLITSREPLRLKWEQRLPVSPLPLPDLEHDHLAQVNLPPSVDLFMQRARAVNLNFAKTQTDLRYVSQVCVRLDGMPLAIELAAARANVLTAEAIAFRMDDTRSLLQNGMRDAPERHQSIHSMLNWSFDLLGDEEQRQFARLGVFSGEFTLEAAGAVLEGMGVDDPIVVLSTLCDKGMVSAATATGTPRYRLHEAVRAYAREHLERLGEMERARTLHAHHYLDVAERESSRFRHVSYLFVPTEGATGSGVRPGSKAWADALAPEYANFHAAILWFAESGSSDLQLRLAASLQWFWWIRGQLDEGIVTLRSALAANSANNHALVVDALCGLGILLRQRGDGPDAAKTLAEAEGLARSVADDPALMRSLIEFSTVQVLLGRFDEAEAALDEAASLAIDTSDPWALTFCRTFIGSIAHFQGRPKEAVRLLEAGGAEFIHLGDERTAAVADTLAAVAALDSGDVSHGSSLVLTCLNFAGNIGEPNLLAAELEIAGWALALHENREAGARLVGAAEAVRVRGFSRTRQEAYCYARAMQALQSGLAEKVLQTSLDAGRALSLDEATSLATSTLQAEMNEDPDTPKTGDKTPLSSREHEVLELIAAGWPNAEIGKHLFVSESTVKFHITSIFNKLGVNRRTEAVAVAVNRKLLTFDGNTPHAHPSKTVAG